MGVEVETILMAFGLLMFVGQMIWHFTQFTRHKGRLAGASVGNELHYEDLGNQARIWANIGPYQIQVDTRMAMQYTKHQHVAVEAKMLFTDAPSGFTVRPEGVSSGLKRLGNKKEIEFDDPDFDNAFWVTADDEVQLRGYLTKERRDALLHWLHRMGSGSIENGAINKSGQQHDYIDYVGPTVSQFLGLAHAFRGNHAYHQSTAQLAPGWVAGARLRQMAWWTALLALFFWILPMEVHLPEWAMFIDKGLVLASLLTAILALAGRPRAVTVLTTLLGLATGGCLMIVSAGLLLTHHPWAAALVFVLSIAWLVIWAGLCVSLYSLRTGREEQGAVVEAFSDCRPKSW